MPTCTADDCKLVLRETNPNSVKWHFALVVIGPSDPHKGLAIEHVTDKDEKCFIFQDHREVSTEGVTAVEAPLIAKKDESEIELAAQVSEIAETIDAAGPEEIKAAGDFKNCFDAAIDAVKKIGRKGYMAPDEVQKFVNYHNQKSAAVKQWTDAESRKNCARDGSGCDGKKASPPAKSKSKSKAKTEKSEKV